MKIPRYDAKRDDPSVKGDIPAEEIVRIDWERNYKNRGISLEEARYNVQNYIDAGSKIYKIRNTLVLVKPDEDFEDVEFHTITADPFEVYFTYTTMFFVSLAMKQGAQYLHTYVDDKKVFRQVKDYFKEYAYMEPNTEAPNKGKYLLTIEIGPFVSAMQRLAAEGGK